MFLGVSTVKNTTTGLKLPGLVRLVRGDIRAASSTSS